MCVTELWKWLFAPMHSRLVAGPCGKDIVVYSRLSDYENVILDYYNFRQNI